MRLLQFIDAGRVRVARVNDDGAVGAVLLVEIGPA